VARVERGLTAGATSDDSNWRVQLFDREISRVRADDASLILSLDLIELLESTSML
jgi:hypothetical protein